MTESGCDRKGGCFASGVGEASPADILLQRECDSSIRGQGEECLQKHSGSKARESEGQKEATAAEGGWGMCSQ